jgi:hypothetical protein
MGNMDVRIESALKRPEPSIGDGGFSETVMQRLPRRRISRTAARRLTLGGAAAAGSILTAALGAPIQTAFGTFMLEGGLPMATFVAMLIVSAIAVPVAWAFYSR